MLEVKIYIINKDQPNQYFGLMIAENHMCLRMAPNNWKTEKGAIRWAEKHGLKVIQ